MVKIQISNNDTEGMSAWVYDPNDSCYEPESWYCPVVEMPDEFWAKIRSVIEEYKEVQLIFRNLYNEAHRKMDPPPKPWEKEEV